MLLPVLTSCTHPERETDRERERERERGGGGGVNLVKVEEV